MFCLVKQTCLKNVRATHDMLLKLLASRTTQKHWTNPMQNAHVHIKDFIQGMGVQGNLRVAPLYDISHLINDAWCVIYEMRMILAAIGEIQPTATRRHRSFRGTWRLTLGSNHCMNMYPASQVIFSSLFQPWFMGQSDGCESGTVWIWTYSFVYSFYSFKALEIFGGLDPFWI